MNLITIIGNLGKAPELNTIGENETSVCKFSVGVARKFKDKDDNKITDWFNVTVWNKLASRVSELNGRGENIVGEFVKVKNRYGEPCEIKRYFFKKEGK
jgi:single-strand DNA-binding protein